MTYDICTSVGKDHNRVKIFQLFYVCAWVHPTTNDLFLASRRFSWEEDHLTVVAMGRGPQDVCVGYF